MLNDPINVNAKPMWSLDEETLEFVRNIEKAIIPAGYHCALGGGVIHKGVSEHDLDIFIYPHKSTDLDATGVREELKRLGIVQKFKFTRSRNSTDNKIVEVWEFNGKKIDFFFMM